MSVLGSGTAPAKGKNLDFLEPDESINLSPEEAAEVAFFAQGFQGAQNPMAQRFGMPNAPAPASPYPQVEQQEQAPPALPPTPPASVVPPSAITNPPQSEAPQPGGATTPPSPEQEQVEGGEGESDGETGTFKITVDGTEYSLTADQIHSLLQQNTWLRTLPEDTISAWGQIEQGTARAVDAQEYAQYQAWKAAGAPATQPAKPSKPDLSLVDPEVAEYIQGLESRVPAIPIPTPDTPPTPVVNPQHLQEQARLQVQREQEITSVTQQFVEKYQLDEAAKARLIEATTQSNAVAYIANANRKFSATGTLIYEKPFPDVLSEAFEATMSTDARLREIRDDHLYNERLAKEQAANAQVNRKKVLAGSLASVPSAAVTSGSTPQGPLNTQQMAAGIAQLIRESQANGTYDS